MTDMTRPREWSVGEPDSRGIWEDDGVGDKHGNDLIFVAWCATPERAQAIVAQMNITFRKVFGLIGDQKYVDEMNAKAAGTQDEEPEYVPDIFDLKIDDLIMQVEKTVSDVAYKVLKRFLG